eukprot:COSAG02_NODE_1650_length_11487_cov_13.602895_11_plen_101_part_00
MFCCRVKLNGFSYGRNSCQESLIDLGGVIVVIFSKQPVACPASVTNRACHTPPKRHQLETICVANERDGVRLGKKNIDNTCTAMVKLEDQHLPGLCDETP